MQREVGYVAGLDNLPLEVGGQLRRTELASVPIGETVAAPISAQRQKYLFQVLTERNRA